jgi:predicted DNA-binding transcriptional regulator AlpA
MSTGCTMKILRTNEVAEMLGISRVTLWRWARGGHLPPKRRIGPNVVGWVEAEILAWLESRPTGSIGVEESSTAEDREALNV